MFLSDCLNKERDVARDEDHRIQDQNGKGIDRNCFLFLCENQVLFSVCLLFPLEKVPEVDPQHHDDNCVCNHTQH
jgi:hypothetical protein